MLLKVVKVLVYVEIEFVQHLTGKCLSFDFYTKAEYFEIKFWSVIDHL